MIPLIRPLYARARAFHQDPAWLEPGRKAQIERSQTPAELMLIELMEAAKAGYPEQLSAVIPLMHQQDDDSFWGRASLLLSHAAPSSVLRELVNSFADAIMRQKDDIVQGFIAETLLNSGMLWTVPVALQILKAQANRTRMFAIPFKLSCLLEAAPAVVFFGPDSRPEDETMPDWFEQPVIYDDEGYEKLVLAVYAERLAAAQGDGSTSLLLGAPVNLGKIAQELVKNIDRVADDDIIARKRMIIEAQTGADLSAFFAETLTLDRKGAMSALEPLFDSVDFAAFEPGRRYFFGRPLD